MKEQPFSKPLYYNETPDFPNVQHRPLGQKWICKSDKHVECVTFLQMSPPLLFRKEEMGSGKKRKV